MNTDAMAMVQHRLTVSMARSFAETDSHSDGALYHAYLEQLQSYSCIESRAQESKMNIFMDRNLYYF
jgi:hypothetical protein